MIREIPKKTYFYCDFKRCILYFLVLIKNPKLFGAFMKNYLNDIFLSLLAYHKQLLVVSSLLLVGLLGDGPPMS